MNEIVIYNSDVYASLSQLEDSSIDIAITSPPYWGQRDYGFNNQIGAEDSYLEYIEILIANFNILKNKLSDKGIFFLNIGDKYIAKYGKTPLGFIPYKLAYFMQKEGWHLNDTIIWYKPNHMPSSIKNRFSNSYEPVFVFSKGEDNYYNDKRRRTLQYSNIIKVPLQPTTFKHVAVYPEKLVYELLKKVELPNNFTILDPFAGSGTTLKVVLENYINPKAIMIEYNDNYIDIIKERCKLNGNVEIRKFDFIPYNVKNLQEFSLDSVLVEPKSIYESKFNKNGIIKVCNSKDEFYNYLKKFQNPYFKSKFSLKATFFIGCKEIDNKLIYDTSLLVSHGWIIRNMLIIEENGRWFPIFMIVDDNKTTQYLFKYKSLNLKSKSEYKRDWNETNFIFYQVVDNVSKIKNTGKIVSIIEKDKNGFPIYVIVKWDNGDFTKEYVVNSQESINDNIIINKSTDGLEILEKKQIINLNNKVLFDYSEEKNDFCLQENSKYDGKFKSEKRINFGASPGARASVDKEYFSVQRLYEVDLALIVDYLNHKRIQKGLSKKELTDYFPEPYKHTVGHWLRKDFGGSLPTPEDWDKLSEILNLDEGVTNYVCKTALKLQTVRHSQYKVPSDFQQIDFVDKLNFLIQ